MGEKFHGGESGYDSYRQAQAEQRERKEKERVKETLQEIQRLLAKLIEKGGDLSAQTRQSLRQQITALLQSIGVNGLDDYRGLMAAYERIQDSFGTLPIPSGFISKDDFRQKIYAVYSQEKSSEKLPPVSSKPKASQVAKYGVSDWQELEERGGVEAIDYLYNLAILISNESSYSTAFPESDAIQVGPTWTIENGRHRSLTLKCLGVDYIEETGIDEWMVIKKEE